MSTEVTPTDARPPADAAAEPSAVPDASAAGSSPAVAPPAVADDGPPRTGLGGFLFRRGLLIFSCFCVVVACVIIAAAFDAERTFRLGTQGLVRTAGWPDAPFESFDDLQEHVKDLGAEHGWSVVPRRRDPLEVTTNWFGDKRLRVLLDELREGS